MKKKVAFVISSLDFGGAQRAVSSVSLGLSEDYDIDIVLNNDTNIVYPYKGVIHSLNIKIPKDRTGLYYQAKVLFRRIWKLKQLKKNNKYDAVISFLDSANVANIVSGNKFGKTIISVRSNLSESKNWKYKYIVSGLVHLFYNKADLVITLSEGVRNDLIVNYGICADKIKTIYNGYDVDLIRRLSKEKTDLYVDEKNINFVSMGRLTHQKGQWHLIRVFAELFKSNRNTRLYILGTGELEGYLRRLIEEYGLDESVFLLGFLDNSYSVLSKMDVFVFPSLYEGFGNALLEAMTCGLPCISTDYKSGAREILIDEQGTDRQIDDLLYADYGIIIPNMSKEHYSSCDALDETEEILKKAMTIMIDDSDMRQHYSDMARERAEYFSLRRCIAEWEQVI